jgi:hypothetical protein
MELPPKFDAVFVYTTATLLVVPELLASGPARRGDMVRRTLITGALLWAVVCPPLGWGQAVDARTAAGQLHACGGAANWQRVGYLEFEVRVETEQGSSGPWLYRWARREGFMRMTGRTPDGAQADVAVELTSRTGGGWKNGVQLTGKALADTVAWALSRFSEDVLWLTFPLEWGAAGVTVRALDDDVGEDGAARPAVEVSSSIGNWKCVLDRETGRIQKTEYNRPGVGSYTALWEDWQVHGGVYFAGRRRILETGETIILSVKQVLAQTPATAF